MSTEKEQDKTQSIELGGKLLSDDDYELLVRMLPYCCCVRCKHWQSLGCPEWPEIVYFERQREGHVDCLSALYDHVHWDGECRRFPPKAVPPEELRTLSVWGWPITSCRDHCGEFTPRD